LTPKTTLGRKISYIKKFSLMKLPKFAKFPLTTPWMKICLDGRAQRMGNINGANHNWKKLWSL
jgi:hypothetical protein